MIDAHQHIWALGRNGCTWPTEAEEPIHRDYGLDDFQAVAAPQRRRAGRETCRETRREGLTGWVRRAVRR